jgi:4-alpha-glucanotransferase
MSKRGIGVLLHITSLPSQYGIGDLGPTAYRFADLLAASGQSYWQILPINPTDLATDNSPYSISSTFAGNILLISPENLIDQQLLQESDLQGQKCFPECRVDYELVTAYKEVLFETAYMRFKAISLKEANERQRYADFCLTNADWLEDFAFFSALRTYFGEMNWSRWPKEIRDRTGKTFKDMRGLLCDLIDRERFLQYIFFIQWNSLKNYCNGIGLKIIGDQPFYVNYSSADVWSDPKMFKLNAKKEPLYVSGYPPDYFNETGQIWNHPIYNWDILIKRKYKWFIRRIVYNLKLFDLLRIDHFSGLTRYWEIKANQKTAENGKWINGPAEDFFVALFEHIQSSKIIADDIGNTNPKVRAIMNRYNIPGIRPLLLAFDNDPSRSPSAPHNHIKNCIVYTGTHDFATARGWFENEASSQGRARLFKYLGRQVSSDNISREFIRLAAMSVANTAILPMQDILSLPGDARMNIPGTNKGNWVWRLLPEQLKHIDQSLLEMAEIYGRT